MQPQDDYSAVSKYFRLREGGGEKATALELFFDLVFVFAITQIAAFLISNLTLVGVAKSLMILLAVWLSWNYTTWMANWFDPEAIPIRLLLLVVMLLNLMMAISVPHAFDSGAWLFATTFVGSQLIRNGFNILNVVPGTRRNGFIRLFSWSMFAGVFWIVGAAYDGDTRLILWCVGVLIDYIAPMVRYWIPTLGATSTDEWDIDPQHFAERFQLLVIVALGESIVVIGSSVSQVGLSTETVLAMVSGFVVTASMWWLYFDYAAEAVMHRLCESGDPGAAARDAFTYLHLPIVAGIIAYAVSLKLVIKHPGDELSGVELAVTLAGPLLFLSGQNLSRYRLVGSFSNRRLYAAGLLIVIIPLAFTVSTLYFSVVITVVMTALAVLDTRGIRRWYSGLEPEQRPNALGHLDRYTLR